MFPLDFKLQTPPLSIDSGFLGLAHNALKIHGVFFGLIPCLENKTVLQTGLQVRIQALNFKKLCLTYSHCRFLYVVELKQCFHLPCQQL